MFSLFGGGRKRVGIRAVGYAAAGVVLAASVATPPPQPPPAGPTPPAVAGDPLPVQDQTLRDFGRDCTRSGCHAGVVDRRWIHGPAAVHDCQVCHEAVGAAPEHRFQLAQPLDKLCRLCHRPPPPSEAKHEHKPFADADCTACHDPHGGSTVSLLKADRAATVCAGCHTLSAHEVVHQPVKEGDCLSCHKPHESPHAALLRQPEHELCLGCHRDVADSLKKAPHVHAAVVDTCLACHGAHGGADKTLLKSPVEELCLHCHQPVAKTLADATSVHAVAKEPRGCIECHRAHASDAARLLRAPEPGLCYQCHDRVITLKSRQISDIKEQVASARDVHEPVAKGDCDACHLPHGAAFPRLLLASYPVTEYAAYSRATYELCFRCHDPALVAQERTTVTGFRDGDRNLHYVHVNDQPGRVCTLCHELHASELPKLIRRSIPYGPSGWKLPINFVKTDHGGSCACGCHRKLSYDNSTPPASPSPKRAR